jgi:hypothetical protein
MARPRIAPGGLAELGPVNWALCRMLSRAAGTALVVNSGGVVGRVLKAPRTALIALLALVGVVLLLRQLSRRRRGQRTPPKLATSREVAARRIVELYRALELSLSARGVPRPSGTPPLAHAESLVAMGHPIADEVLALTEQYVRVRFGGEALGDSDRRHYAERVRAIKQARVERPAAA